MSSSFFLFFMGVGGMGVALSFLLLLCQGKNVSFVLLYFFPCIALSFVCARKG
jgi:hypothetical protein